MSSILKGLVRENGKRTVKSVADEIASYIGDDPSDSAIVDAVEGEAKIHGFDPSELFDAVYDHFRDHIDENLHKWFKEKWVRFGPDGKIRGACARGSSKEGKPKCLPQKKAQNLGKKGRKYAAAKKRREDPNPDRHGKAKNVATKKKSNEDISHLDEKWSAKYKSSINCSHPKGFSQKAHCAGKKKHNESIEMEMTCEDCGMCQTHGNHTRDTLDEACWKGYHKEGNKELFGKTVPNCVKNEGVAEGSEPDAYGRTGEEHECGACHGSGQEYGETCVTCGGKGWVKDEQGVAEEKCPHCGGELVSEEMINEKQDACYRKVKSRYKVWPSAYASGALVQCRKKGAANWGNKSESVEEAANAAQQAAIAINMKKHHKKPKHVDEDYTGIESGPSTGPFTAEKTPAINPYGGMKDRKYRGAIGEGILSEMPDTSGPVGVQPGGRRTYKPKPAGTDMKKESSILKGLMREEESIKSNNPVGIPEDEEMNEDDDFDFDYSTVSNRSTPDKTKMSDTVTPLVQAFNIEHGDVLRVKRSSRRWRRGDGSQYTDPGRIIAVDTADAYLQHQFFDWLLQQPGVKPVGKIRGEFRSSDYSDAVKYKGLIFINRSLYTEFITPSRLRNSRVWHQQTDEDTAYAGGMGQGGNAGESYRKFKPKSAGTHMENESSIMKGLMREDDFEFDFSSPAPKKAPKKEKSNKYGPNTNQVEAFIRYTERMTPDQWNNVADLWQDITGVYRDDYFNDVVRASQRASLVARRIDPKAYKKTDLLSFGASDHYAFGTVMGRRWRLMTPKSAAWEIIGADAMREADYPFFFLPMFGFDSPDDIPGAVDLEEVSATGQGGGSAGIGGGSMVGGPTTYEQEYGMFKKKGPRRITAMTNEVKNVSPKRSR